MNPSGDIERRLAAHIRERVTTKTSGEAPFYLLVRHPDKAIVVEREKAGEARIEITSRFAEPDEIIDRPRQLQMDWQNDDITLGDFEGRFAHRKIELDGEGNGSIGLS